MTASEIVDMKGLIIGLTKNAQPVNLNVAPNPTSGFVEISTTNQMRGIIITNVIGHRVKELHILLSKQVVIDVGDLANGMHVLTVIYSSDDEETAKMIKVH